MSKVSHVALPIVKGEGGIILPCIWKENQEPDTVTALKNLSVLMLLQWSGS